MFLEGNVVILNEYFQLVFQREDVDVCYFGSHYYKDIYATLEFNKSLCVKNSPACWDAIAIVNEFGNFDY